MTKSRGPGPSKTLYEVSLETKITVFDDGTFLPEDAAEIAREKLAEILRDKGPALLFTLTEKDLRGLGPTSRHTVGVNFDDPDKRELEVINTV